MSENLHINHNLNEVIRKLDELAFSVKKNIQLSAQLKNQFASQNAVQKNIVATTKKQTSAFTGLHGMMVRLFAVMGARQMARFGKDAIMVAADLEAMRTAMNFATGGTVAGTSAMIQAKSVAQEYGLALLPAVEGLTKLQAATKGTSLAGKPAMDLFKGISKAVAVLGLNSERSHGTFMAFEQIISKGKVSAEELRRQLGDRIPGAFQIAARAMGVSTTKLDKMIRTGQLMSDVFIPKMSAQLEKEFAGGIDKASETTRASLNRLNNSVLDIKETLGTELYPAVDIANNALHDFAAVSEWSIELAKDSPNSFTAMAMGIGAVGAAATASMLGLNPYVAALVAIGVELYAINKNMDQTTNKMRTFDSGMKSGKELIEMQDELLSSMRGVKAGTTQKSAFVTEAEAHLAGIESVMEQLEKNKPAMSMKGLHNQLKETIGHYPYTKWMQAGQNMSLDHFYPLAPIYEPEELQKGEKIRDQMKQLEAYEKMKADLQAMKDETMGFGSELGANLDADAGLDSDATGVATVNGSGNHIMNIQIGNIVENLTNEFREGDGEQNEIESEKQLDIFKKGLFGVINDMKQLNQA